jgi:cytochrome c oxidase subunit 2
MDRRPVRVAVVLVIACAGLTSACSGAPSPLSPKGPGASDIARLWWLMFWIAAAVCAVVTGLLLYAAVRSRGRQGGPPIRRPASVWPVVVGGIVVPLIVLAGVFAYSIHTQAVLSKAPSPADLTIEVIGHDWWWEVRYPAQGFTTANEIHIPAGRAVELKLSSVDVVHSFWVPELQSKRDLIPGHTNTLWLQADKPGDYRGQCAEYCGVQHAHMAFSVIAQSSADFDAWVARMRQPAAAPADPLAQRGWQVFEQMTCSSCHAVQGVSARGNAGPDLTHLQSRGLLAAGTLPNNRANLASWITAPGAIKPGVNMPAFDELDSPTLQALLAFLETLQ